MDVRRTVAAALCVPLLALAGCSEDKSQADPQDPTSSAAPSPSPSETETAPSIPPEAKQRTGSGAKAFVRHWVAALNYASATGKTQSLLAASTKGCETCTNYVELIDKIYGPGGRIDSEGWEVLAAKPDIATSGTRVALVVRQSSEVIRYEDPSKTEKFDGGRQKFLSRLAWTEDGWRMDRLDIES